VFTLALHCHTKLEKLSLHDSLRQDLLHLKSAKLIALGSGHLTRLSVLFAFLSRRPRFFWLASRIETSGTVQFSEHVQSNRVIFWANQICQTLSLGRVTGSLWIVDFRSWIFPEAAILDADQEERSLWGRECVICNWFRFQDSQLRTSLFINKWTFLPMSCNINNVLYFSF